MRCPNCARPLGAFALRCRVCHQMLTRFYVVAAIVLILVFILLVKIIEHL
jgi:hypothetical protein